MSSRLERFWSLAEAAERGVVRDRSRPSGMVRHVLDVVRSLNAGSEAGPAAASTQAFLADLRRRDRGTDEEAAVMYSIGVLLFEGLTGRDPLGAVAGPRRFGSLTPDELAELIRRAPEVPASLRGVLVGLTGAEPSRRFESVAAVKAELEWFVVSEEEGELSLPDSSPHHVALSSGVLVADDADAPRLESGPVVPIAVDNTAETRRTGPGEPAAARARRLILIGLSVLLGSALLTAAVLSVLR